MTSAKCKDAPQKLHREMENMDIDEIIQFTHLKAIVNLSQVERTGEHKENDVKRHTVVSKE